MKQRNLEFTKQRLMQVTLQGNYYYQLKCGAFNQTKNAFSKIIFEEITSKKSNFISQFIF